MEKFRPQPEKSYGGPIESETVFHALDGRKEKGILADFTPEQQAEIKQKQQLLSFLAYFIKLIYYEACLTQADATKREKYFKTHYGKMFLKKRLKSYLTG